MLASSPLSRSAARVTLLREAEFRNVFYYGPKMSFPANEIAIRLLLLEVRREIRRQAS